MPYRVFFPDDFNNQHIIYKENPFPFRLDLPRYCPQDNTGFYTIDYDATGEEDSCNYCPQDNTGFYDFDQAPQQNCISKFINDVKMATFINAIVIVPIFCN